jgi:2-polyprenyl-3-methyl-5-hydroxy-6-metoxy-1,4-benzoquinol methylase
MAIFPALVRTGRAMSSDRTDMSTDVAWEEWGRRDPYFGVITNPKFRRNGLNEDAKREFFGDGETLVNYLLATIHRHIDPQFTPKKILDFGCGVGRLLVPFARVAEEVVGLDVSPAMLEEARRNCEERHLRNVRLLPSDDDLSALSGSFDLIHSFIVFQHIPIRRGRAIFGKLLQHLRPGGVGAIHMTYSKTRFGSTHGVAPLESPSPAPTPQAIPAEADPEMQMNPYNMNEILFLLQCVGVQRTYVEFSDHGGELGVFLFFSVTGAPIPIS